MGRRHRSLFPFGYAAMKAHSVFVPFFVTMAQVGFCAETNAVSPELAAWLDLRLHQLRVKGASSWVTNAPYNEGKLLVMVKVLGAHDQEEFWTIRQDGKREGCNYRGTSRKLPKPLKDLTSHELERLRAALAELPSSATNMGTNRTTVIGFRSGTNWLSGVYDTGGLYHGYRQMRNRKANEALIQGVETARAVLPTTPQGQAADAQFVKWLMEHQKEAGVFATVSQMVDRLSDNPAAKMTAQEIAERVRRAQGQAAPATS
jgi:hypothetical protein